MNTIDEKQTVTLSDRNHQPTRAEMNEQFKVNVPGRDTPEKLDNFALATTRPVKIRYQKRK